MFRYYDATVIDKDLPILVELDNGMVGYIREPRINLLTSKQTVEGKVDYILEEYHEVSERKCLYKDFLRFVDRRYRYVRCDTGENGAFPPTRNGCIHSLSMRERG